MKKFYLQSFKFLKENKLFFYIISGLFTASIILGYLLPIFFEEFIRQFIEQITEKTVNMNFIQLFLFILQNNIKTAFLGLVFGVLFGIIPLFLTFFNGYVLGFVINKVLSFSDSSVLLRLLPHGIFEIPALIISLVLGLKLGMFIFKKKGSRKKEFFYSLENSLQVFLFIVVPLLILAGLIEAALIIWLR